MSFRQCNCGRLIDEIEERCEVCIRQTSPQRLAQVDEAVKILERALTNKQLEQVLCSVDISDLGLYPALLGSVRGGSNTSEKDEVYVWSRNYLA